MSQLILQSATCRNCDESLIESDNFCRICGAARNSEVAVANTANEIQYIEDDNRQSLAKVPPSITWLLNNRMAIVAVIAVIGPLGLPALWFSPRFSKTAKIVTTVIYFLLTAVLPLVFAWYCLDVLVQPLVDAMQNR